MLVPDCKGCGACCAYSRDWVEIAARDTQVPRELTEESHPELWPDVEPEFIPRRVMRTTGPNLSLPVLQSEPESRGQRCVALVGEIGKGAHCSIYENRPTVCRSFERGNPICVWFLGRYSLGRPW